ncbi:hypothetical protein Gogos_020070 [Gossypium gossypioides]|uniref:Uncharacterized protein n=1 Tax=Gossypium gossypioides TaxID=34282 RepID=A0A7J9CY07_GOSGO|nr:hypothetical protein [Gossypium gossypioides]
MKWLKINLKELPPNAIDVVKEQSARAFILRWNHGPSYVGIPEQLKDIKLLMPPAKIFDLSEYMRREGVVDSVRDGENVRIRSSDTAVRVEATNSVTITRHGSTVQRGAVKEER